MVPHGNGIVQGCALQVFVQIGREDSMMLVITNPASGSVSAPSLAYRWLGVGEFTVTEKEIGNAAHRSAQSATAVLGADFLKTRSRQAQCLTGRVQHVLLLWTNCYDTIRIQQGGLG